MIRLQSAPLHDWQRHYAGPRRIARELLASPAVLNLRTRRLVADVQGRFGVANSTAMKAVSLAREALAA